MLKPETTFQEPEGFQPGDASGPSAYTPYTPAEEERLVIPYALADKEHLVIPLKGSIHTGKTVSVQVGDDSIVITRTTGDPNAARLATTIIGPLFLFLGIIFLCVAIFTTDGGSEVQMIFGILGSVFSTVGGIVSVLAVQAWRRYRNLR
ncbi:MAG: hypothetical protein LBG99_05030 [Propionibacteriaceae bacterium]|jgi:hypothetical protein|nr:hypothetical protein [Propionibacteriaceae bacterium]